MADQTSIEGVEQCPTAEAGLWPTDRWDLAMTYHPQAGDDAVASYRLEEDEVHVRYQQRSRSCERRPHRRSRRRAVGRSPPLARADPPVRGPVHGRAGRV